MRNQVNQKSHGHCRHWLHQFPGRLITATNCQTYDWPAVSNDEWPPGHRPVAARCTQPITQSCVARPADPSRPQRTRQTATGQQGNRPSVRSPDRKAMRNTYQLLFIQLCWSKIVDIYLPEVFYWGNYMVPRTHRHRANREFAVAAPSSWNSLPDNVPESQSYSNFLSKLKTHYFNIAFYNHIIC